VAIFDFIGQLAFYVWFCTAIFWAIVNVAFASWAKQDIRIWGPIGGVFPIIGFVALVIFHFANQANKKQGKAEGGTAYDEFSSAGSKKFSDSFSFSPDPFGNGTGSFSSAPAFQGFDFDSKDASNKSWIFTHPGIWFFAGSVIISIAFVLSLFLTWFTTIDEQRVFMEINAFSTGLDFWIFISVGGLIAAVLLSLKGASRIGAVIIAWIATWWLLLSMASLTAREVFVPAIDLLFQIPNLIVKGSGGDSEISSAFAYDVGAAWYVVFVNSLLLVAASSWLISQAHFREKQSSY
jgi:hypothetical protein